MSEKSYIKFLEEAVSVQKQANAPCSNIIDWGNKGLDAWDGSGKLKTDMDGDIEYLVKKITKGDGDKDKAIQDKKSDSSPLSILEKDSEEIDNEIKMSEDDEFSDEDDESSKNIGETIDLSSVESDILSRLISEMDGMGNDDEEDFIDNELDTDEYVDDEEDMNNDIDIEDTPDEDDYLGY